MFARPLIAAAVALATALPIAALTSAHATDAAPPAAPDGAWGKIDNLTLTPGASASTPVLAMADPVASTTTSIGSYVDAWFSRVDAARASQPHWAAPLITTTPMMIEQLRGDMYYEHLGNGANVLNLGGGKGLELIPTTDNEVFISLPPYQERYDVKPVSGLTDWQFLLVKQRLLSANEQDGDYVLSAFLAVQAPIGIAPYTNHAYVFTPTLAGGKGFGDFDIQATSGLSLPTDHSAALGASWSTNVAFQYRIARIFTPEVEVNWTRWLDGTQRGGKNQVFLTVGGVVGTVRLTDRLGLALGAGYQFAVAPAQQIKPVLTPMYGNNWIVSARMPF